MSVVQKAAIIGSGNWGSVIAKIVATNMAKQPTLFHPTLPMWVHQETTNEGLLLTDVINNTHMNTKYLPNIILPSNIHAEPDLARAIEGADLLIFVVPHQFISVLCDKMKPHIAPGARAISLIKGVDLNNHGLALVSSEIAARLGINVSVLMGANIAEQVAQELFSEATLGYSDEGCAKDFRRLFHCEYFSIALQPDISGVELCGALKNIVALAAGFCDGMQWGSNSKAAVIRLGLLEMRNFARMFDPSVRDDTFFQSCGVGDLFTTCTSGRNHRVALAHIQTKKSFQQLEIDMLGGQKLQGTGTAAQVYQVLQAKDVSKSFPLFTAVYEIIYKGRAASTLVANTLENTF